MGKLGVPGAQLCENGFEHLRLLLDNLAQLLKLGIVAEKVEVAQALLATCSRRCYSCSRRSASTTRAPTRSTPLLSSEIKEIQTHVLVSTGFGSGCRWR